MNIDFAALNLTGFIFYTIFNSGLYYSSLVQSLYEKQFPRSEIPVELNDVIYSIHAAIVTGITVVQCFIYDVLQQNYSMNYKYYYNISFAPLEGRTENINLCERIFMDHVVGSFHTIIFVHISRAVMAHFSLIFFLR